MNSAAKPLVPGRPSDARPAMLKHHHDHRHLPCQTAERVEIAFVGFVIDQPYHGKEQPGNNAVAEHL